MDEVLKIHEQPWPWLLKAWQWLALHGSSQSHASAQTVLLMDVQKGGLGSHTPSYTNWKGIWKPHNTDACGWISCSHDGCCVKTGSQEPELTYLFCQVNLGALEGNSELRRWIQDLCSSKNVNYFLEWVLALIIELGTNEIMVNAHVTKFGVAYDKFC